MRLDEAQQQADREVKAEKEKETATMEFFGRQDAELLARAQNAEAALEAMRTRAEQAEGIAELAQIQAKNAEAECAALHARIVQALRVPE